MPEVPNSLPLSFATYRVHPELLTRFSDPTSTAQPYDGRVGAILPNNHLISSPNCDVLFEPPLSTRYVRLRRNLHYFHDDPLFYPQPFNQLLPHLPLIRTPSPDPKHPFAAAWINPLDVNIDVENGGMLYDAGVLDNDFYLQIKSLANDVLGTFTFDNDPDTYLTQGALQVNRMLESLHMAAPRDTMCLRIAFLQRNILELDARIRYRSWSWTIAVEESKRSAKTPPLLDVIGAFTEDLATLDTLYHLGIPVWFVRPVKATPDARIDRAASLIAEDSLQLIKLPSGLQVDGTDANPPHVVIWEGQPNEPERLIAMNSYLQSLLYPSSIFGRSSPQSPHSYQKALAARARFYHLPSNVSTSTSINHQANTRSATRARPYSQHIRKKPQIHKQGNNTFLDLNSPAMPPAVPVWSRALSVLSTYNQSLRRPETIDCGYFLPPPRLLDGPATASLRAFYYRSWLKLRPMILQTLNGLREPVNLTAKRWRSLLDVVGGHPAEKTEKTKNAVYRNEMRIVLENLVAKTDSRSFRVNVSKPQAEEFAGQLIDCSTEPPSSEVASSILWEIFELSFRQEFVALDRLLDNSGLPLPQRNALLDACWVGPRHKVDVAKAGEGLAASDIHKRLPYIRAVHQVMRTWKGDKPEELYNPFPDNFEAHNFIPLVERVERSLTTFYTTSFLTTFARAASIPHYLTKP
ncbi:hypothetical protein F5878DRAFT_665074 [Lentinula raphanica]|uniref:Uncharacterized protein n=1 Tax=Lentinula raphanica TaxID=153919 RepID=A0AA38P0L8_9AGAR|nr:hypothetical protein F5878DRAFT_665074 [Lentinula raphanica]